MTRRPSPVELEAEERAELLALLDCPVPDAAAAIAAAASLLPPGPYLRAVLVEVGLLEPGDGG